MGMCASRVVLAVGLTVMIFTREFKLHQAYKGAGGLCPLYRFL